MPGGLGWAVLNKDKEGFYLCLKSLPSKSDPFETDGAGAGCLMIRRDVLETIPFPWFRWKIFSDGGKTGEDVFFSKRCNERGWRFSIDPLVRCHHYKEIDLLQLMQD
jgi:GT2 family glycosyltransferase